MVACLACHRTFLAGKTPDSAWLPDHLHAATDVAAFYFAKSRKDHRLAGLTICGNPGAGVEALQSCGSNYHTSKLEIQPSAIGGKRLG